MFAARATLNDRPADGEPARFTRAARLPGRGTSPSPKNRRPPAVRDQRDRVAVQGRGSETVPG